MSPDERTVVQAIGSLQEQLAHDLERLGAHLCSDAAFAQTNMVTLQSIDLIAQKQMALSCLLRENDIHYGVTKIGLHELSDSLRCLMDGARD